MNKTPKIVVSRTLGVWDGKKIAIDPDQSDANILSTLIHELLHYMFDDVIKLPDNKNTEKLVADCERILGDCICKHFEVKCKVAVKKKIRKELIDLRRYKKAKKPTRN